MLDNITVFKLFLKNSYLKQLFTKFIICYLKPYNCLQIIGVR